MQFEVPQFIEVEDKIFGPLSLKQFIYVAGSLGAAALLFFYLPKLLSFVLMPIVLALGFGLAFIPVNKRPLSVLLESVFIYFSKTRLYLWKQERRTPVGTPDSAPEASTTYAPPAAKNTIANLARSLELDALNKETPAKNLKSNIEREHA